MPRLEASNLGQIIGRAYYGEIVADRVAVQVAEAAVAAVPPKLPPPLPGRTGNGWTQRIRDELAGCEPGCGLTMAQIATRLGRHMNDISGLLAQMNGIEKTGTRGHYVYRLKPLEA